MNINYTISIIKAKLSLQADKGSEALQTLMKKLGLGYTVYVKWMDDENLKSFKDYEHTFLTLKQAQKFIDSLLPYNYYYITKN